MLSGGIKATYKLSPANCTAGPGDSLSVVGGPGGGWESLYLTASDPKPGHRGSASVELNETGYKNSVSAVADWGWTAKNNSGHISQPLSITSNGESGSIKTVLSVADVFDGPKIKPVTVTASWNPGTCKA